MRLIDENSITDAALDQMAGTPDVRLKEIMTSLVRHLHDFAREVDLTPDEWIQGIGFLTAVGQKCSDRRQEFVLLSDTLGLSSLVNALHDRRAIDSAATKSSVLGPFYRETSPEMKLGDSIAAGAYPNAQEVCIYGRVTDAAGKPIPNASVEIWQPDETGTYDMQKEDVETDLRGTFHANAEGRYYLRSILPSGYMIPMDGPVGNMIRAQRRHGYRPAHIHFVVGAPGYREVVTALYITGDSHLESDTVFGVTESLVVQVQDKDGVSPIPALPSIRFDLQLASGAVSKSGRVGADPAQIGKHAPDAGVSA